MSDRCQSRTPICYGTVEPGSRFCSMHTPRVGIGNRPVGTPITDGQVPLRWRNVDADPVRTMRLNTGYRYPGDPFTGE